MIEAFWPLFLILALVIGIVIGEYNGPKPQKRDKRGRFCK